MIILLGVCAIAAILCAMILGITAVLSLPVGWLLFVVIDIVVIVMLIIKLAR